MSRSLFDGLDSPTLPITQRPEVRPPLPDVQRGQRWRSRATGSVFKVLAVVPFRLPVPALDRFAVIRCGEDRVSRGEDRVIYWPRYVFDLLEQV